MRHRGFKIVLAAAVAAGLVAVVSAGEGFVRTAEARLAGLPARVRTEAADRGDRFLPLAVIPLAQRHAVVAVENRSFYTDIGISFEGLARAAWIDLVERRFAQGGSTITEDLVRDQLLQPHERTIPWKLKEIAYALLAARRFSKAQIMDMFLNQAYFGHQAYGVAAAAHTYFGVGLRELNLRQETLLAGLLQAPTALDPLVHPRAALARQAVVLTAMVSTGYLTPAQARVVAGEPLGLVRAGR